VPTLSAELQKAIDGMGIKTSVTDDHLLRSEMASGVQRVRRKLSRRKKSMSIKMILKNTQLYSFEQFYEDELYNGSIPFFMTNPVTGLQISAMIDKGGFKHKPLGLDNFELTMRVEFLD
jgi:hypothetical protein